MNIYEDTLVVGNGEFHLDDDGNLSIIPLGDDDNRVIEVDQLEVWKLVQFLL